MIRYLRRVSWDFCGIELVRNDLLDISIQANAENQELFDSISDAKIFVEEVKPSLKTLRAADYFWFVAPLYFFFGWGVEGLLLYPVIGDWVFELSVGYLMQLVVAVTAFCALFRRMMEQVGFPPREHWLKYATWLVLYIVTRMERAGSLPRSRVRSYCCGFRSLAIRFFACFWVQDCMQYIFGDMEKTRV